MGRTHACATHACRPPDRWLIGVGDGPVFICGLAFSGKTPLRIALSMHPRLELTRRTAMWTRYHGRFGDLTVAGNLDRCLSQMLADPAIAALEPDRADIVDRFTHGPATYARLFSSIHQQHADRLGKARWGDQMGMLEQHADLVLSSYPAARMIHMIRDPRHRLSAASGRHRQLPGKLGWETARWRHSAELAVRNHNRFPGRYRIVHYERLCAEPEETLRDVCVFVGEDYVPAMAGGLDRVASDEGAMDDHDQDPRREAVSAFIERHAAVQLRAHDYTVPNGHRARTLPPSFYLIDAPCNMVGIAMWRIARSARGVSEEAA